MEWNVIFRRQIAWSDLEAEQSELVARVGRKPNERYLLVSEPEPVFTSGRGAPPADLLWSASEQSAKGVTLHTVNRGGKWTYHGPGQIVIYPIANVADLGYGRHAAYWFLHDLRQSVLAGLTNLGVSANPGEKPFGVFVNGQKLVSFGISLRGGISSHGLALYHSSQQSYFAGIHPCGMAGAPVTSLVELGSPADWDEAARQMVQSVKKGLKRSKNSLG